VRLVCASINTIQETAGNKESTKRKEVLLENKVAIKWNATDKSKVPENYTRKRVGEEQMSFTMYYLIFGLPNTNQS